MKVTMIRNPEHDVEEVERRLRGCGVEYETVPTHGRLSYLNVDGRFYPIEGEENWREGVLLAARGDFLPGVFGYVPQPGKRRILNYFGDEGQRCLEVLRVLEDFRDLFGLEFVKHFAVDEWAVPQIQTVVTRSISYGYETYQRGLLGHMMLVFGPEAGEVMVRQYEDLFRLGWRREGSQRVLRAVG